MNSWPGGQYKTLLEEQHKKEEQTMSISVVYWSGTGNTKAMAGAVAEGIEEAGAGAEVRSVDQADADALAAESAFALGCPSMGAEELEESEREPFVAELEGKVKGKKILLVGSYGWGDGEWMRNWEERMKNAGAILVTGAGIIANEAPDGAAIDALKAAGKEMVSV